MPSGNSAAGSRRRSQDPEKFGGTEKDMAKRQQQYVDWCSQISHCFDVDCHIFDTEYRKIQHIAGLLKDDAFGRTREHFDTVTEYPNDPEYWALEDHNRGIPGLERSVRNHGPL
jgi:hypothetical protein